MNRSAWTIGWSSLLFLGLAAPGCTSGELGESSDQQACHNHEDANGSDDVATSLDSGADVEADAGSTDVDTGSPADASGQDTDTADTADSGPDAVADTGSDADATTPPDAIYVPLAPEPSQYDAPLRITSGGTYSGAWRSDDPNTAAVVIATDEPVIIENCFVRTAQWGFREGAPGVDLTIRNCQIRPTPGNKGQAHAINIASASNLRIENNYFEDVDGIEIYQWWVESTPAQTLHVVGNRAKNISTHMGNFVILNTVGQLRDAEIAWNEVINEPDMSSVEDNINIYNSSGVAGSPLRIHNNFVWGAFPNPALAERFTGTGITTDGSSDDPAKITAHVHAYDNQFVGTCNAAMNIAAGHDITYERNRMITSAKLADGRELNATHAATAIFDFYNAGPTKFYNHRVDDNIIGFVSPGYNRPYADRNDGSWDGCDTCSNTSLPNPITYAMEEDEYARWQAKVAAAGRLIGPR